MKFVKLLKQMARLRAKKNSDYGNDFIESYVAKRKINTTIGNMTIYSDLHRKIARIDNLLLNNKLNEVDDETVVDTFMDLAIMSLNAILALKKVKK